MPVKLAREHVTTVDGEIQTWQPVVLYDICVLRQHTEMCQ